MAVFEPRGNPIAGLNFRTMRLIGYRASGECLSFTLTRSQVNHATATDGRLHLRRDPLHGSLAAPIEVYACHCTDCQRITSSAFSIGVVVPDEAFGVTGKTAITVPGGVTEGGRVKSRWVCPDCGTWLFGNPRPGTQYPGMFRVVRGERWMIPRG